MEKATLNAVMQRAQAREDFAHSAENRRRGPERELTHAEREGGEEFRQKRARSAVPSVDAHRDRYAAAVAIQAAVMAKAACALIALHEGLHYDVCQDAGNDYCEWHSVCFGCDGLGNGPHLDAVVALSVRIAADAIEALRHSLTKNQHHYDEGLGSWSPSAPPPGCMWQTHDSCFPARVSLWACGQALSLQRLERQQLLLLLDIKCGHHQHVCGL